MTLPPWTPRPALAGEHSVDTVAVGQVPRVRLVELPARHTLLVQARRGRLDSLVSRVQSEVGLALPTRPRRIAMAGLEAVWSGPAQWLIMGETAAAAQQQARLRAALQGLASCTDQSDARVLLGLSGSAARRALMKLVGIDVHPRAFAVDDVALTPIAHIPVHLWRRPDEGAEPVFVIAGPWSTAGSLWHAIVAAGAELSLAAHPLQPAAPAQ
jgi:sarcosine oxidase subunit gamma